MGVMAKLTALFVLLIVVCTGCIQTTGVPFVHTHEEIISLCSENGEIKIDVDDRGNGISRFVSMDITEDGKNKIEYTPKISGNTFVLDANKVYADFCDSGNCETLKCIIRYVD